MCGKLPANWKVVPSLSRPGEFSYLHTPTGFKMAQLPTSDAPEPRLLAAWKRANSSAPVGRAPPTPVAPTPSAAAGRAPKRHYILDQKLEPVLEASDPASKAHNSPGNSPPLPALKRASPPPPPSAALGQGAGLRRIWTPPPQAQPPPSRPGMPQLQARPGLRDPARQLPGVPVVRHAAAAAAQYQQMQYAGQRARAY